MGFMHACTAPVPVFDVEKAKDYAYQLLRRGLSD